jgi:hypothetical protein
MAHGPTSLRLTREQRVANPVCSAVHLGRATAEGIVAGYGEPGDLRTTVQEAVTPAQVQYVTTLRHVAGKSYPSPDRCGRAAWCICSRTVFSTSGERARRTGDEDAAVWVT